jgi:hypothetical protein
MLQRARPLARAAHAAKLGVSLAEAALAPLHLARLASELEKMIQ